VTTVDQPRTTAAAAMVGGGRNHIVGSVPAPFNVARVIVQEGAPPENAPAQPATTTAFPVSVLRDYSASSCFNSRFGAARR
jgi:hypothetical protein